MATSEDLPGIVALVPGFQHYAWGDASFIPRLFGISNPGGEPYAEAWLGAHPLLSARCLLEGEEQDLASLAADFGSQLLGPAVVQRFGELPYMLKVISAAKPLSIQVHPSRSQAEEGYAKEEAHGIPVSAPGRNYRDRNHKPELVVALGDFWACRGFRPAVDVVASLHEAPELRPVATGIHPNDAGIRTLVERWLALPPAEVEAILAPLVARLRAQDSRCRFVEDDHRYWVLRAHDEFSRPQATDRGLFFLYVLNLIRLRRGQALYLSPGVLHAYLRGPALEIMANSDNVIRCGLTSKHVDATEVLRVTDFRGETPQILDATRIPGTPEHLYPSAVDEFQLRRIELTGGESYRPSKATGPQILLVADAAEGAEVAVRSRGRELRMGRGGACILRHDATFEAIAPGAATVFRACVPRADSPKPPREEAEAPSYRGRRPTALAFGTSGLRGRVSDITDLEATVNVRGFLEYLRSTGDVRPGASVAIAGDLRPSTDGEDRSILRAVARAIAGSGLRAVNCGKIPTPALTYYALERRWPSVMVTGSHIPFDRNGIKFSKSRGEVLKPDELGILAAVGKARREEYARPAAASDFDDEGMLRPDAVHPLPPEDPSARDTYLRRYLEFFPPDCLAGLRLLLFEHSAVGRDLLAEILAGLGAQVVRAGRSAEFVSIDTEAISGEMLHEIQRLADDARRRHGRIDAVVSTDGDSDRPLLIGVDVDGRVRFFRGDALGIVVAEYLDADSIAVPVSSSDAVDLFFGARGVLPRRTRIGSPYVIAAMEESTGSRIVGWEANGGFLTGSDLHRDGRLLRALPTRDAVLPIVSALHAAACRGLDLAGLFDRLPRRFSRSGLLDDVPAETSRALIERLSPGDPMVREVLFDGERVTLREADGSELDPEATLAAGLRRIRDELSVHFGPERGFDEVWRIDFLDGVRVTFRCGDVVHVRPSGNAPQLRVYAVAGSEGRASEIVRDALREPDGILRGMEAAVARSMSTRRILENVALTHRLFRGGCVPEVIGTVSGSAASRVFWQTVLDRVRRSFGARLALSFEEDLPTNQAFGVLLLWQRLREQISRSEGALVAFVFGEGTRSTPFTEAECGQKPAIATFVPVAEGGGVRYLSMVELALRYFAPVERYLKRSGFRGLVVKWGDEVQIAAHDLSGSDPRFAEADVVRFVSLRRIDEEDARSKDWVGVDAGGSVAGFVPRRPLREMEPVADRGLLLRRGAALYGGVNLGSIALSYPLLDVLLEEFSRDVNDPRADRSQRPDLDPQFFTAMTVALVEDPGERGRAWEIALSESEPLRRLKRQLPDVIDRLRRAYGAFARRCGRSPRMLALDFGDPYWGDIGQHTKIRDFYTSLNDRGPNGDIARALAGVDAPRDPNGAILVGECSIAPGTVVRDSVLVNARIAGGGRVVGSVLVGTQARTVEARGAFDVLSVVTDLGLAPGAGTYRVVSTEPVRAGPGERVTTLFLPGREVLARVLEETDLRDRAQNYDRAVQGNPVSFREAHETMSSQSHEELTARREAAERKVLDEIRKRS